MNVEELRRYTRQQPFRPFRLDTSDQASYEVRHPEMILLSRMMVVIAHDIPAPDDMPDRVTWVDPIHITRIEPMNPAESKGNGRPKK